MRTMKRINNNFTLTEATELGTHCALHHSYSPQEQKYLFRLDVFDQKEIRLAISQKAHHGEMDFSAFERVDNMLRLEVPYKALEPCKSHYRNLEKALIDIGKKPVGIPYTDPSGSSPTLCYREFSYLLRYVRDHKVGQEKRVILEMPIEVAKYYFALDLGYFKVSPQVYESFRHQSSRCLYLLSESRLKQGYVKFRPAEILSLLTSKTVYRGTGNLEYFQLSVAEEEIKDAYNINLLDYIVIHTIATCRNQVVGTYGSLVIFEIKFRNEDENALKPADRQELVFMKFKLRKTLTEAPWNVNFKVAFDLSQRLTLEDKDPVNQCFTAAYDAKAKHGLTNPPGYIVKCLDKILKKKN